MDYHQIEAFLSKTTDAVSAEQITQHFFEIVDNLGFDTWAYLFQRPSSGQAATPEIYSNYDVEWVNHYIEQGYSDIDPVVYGCMNSFQPFQWADLYRNSALTQKQKILYEEAKGYRLGDGIGIPIKIPSGKRAVVSLVSTGAERESSLLQRSETLPTVLTLSYLLHLSLRNLDNSRGSKNRHQNLTVRELECLKWIASGKCSWDISRILGISERTVIYHIENAKKKLCANNRTQAVATAFQAGLIDPVL